MCLLHILVSFAMSRMPSYIIMDPMYMIIGTKGVRIPWLWAHGLVFVTSL